MISSPASAMADLRSRAMKSAAPEARIRLSTSATLVSSGWAMSAVKQTTLTRFSVSHLVTVQLSSPPEAAKATVCPFRSCTVTLTSRLQEEVGTQYTVHSRRPGGGYPLPLRGPRSLDSFGGEPWTNGTP